MIPKRVEETMQMVFEYAPSIRNWRELKVEIMKHLPWELRTFFSRRDEVTKKHHLNDFDREIIKRWEELTGDAVVIDI